MKNYAKYLMLFIFIFYYEFLSSSIDNAVGYLHNKILEKTVPELKEFNNKLTELFRIKDNGEKIKATKQLMNFVQETRKKLTNEINAKKMTPAEVKTIKMALGIMRRRIGKLEAVKQVSI